MTHDEEARVLAHIEAALIADDPAFARRFARILRRSILVEALTAGLLMTGAVLLITGLATKHWPIALGGASALLSSATASFARQRVRQHRH